MRSPALSRALVHVAAAFATVAPLAGCAASGRHETQSAQSQAHVGVYDSHAVAIAWFRSASFQESMRELQREHAGARAAGYTTRAAELDARAPAIQEQAHLQGFGTAPVDDVLARVAQEIPALRERAGVNELVSMWAPNAPVEGATDVTDDLVRLFHPDAETLRVTREIRSKQPEPNTGTAVRD